MGPTSVLRATLQGTGLFLVGYIAVVVFSTIVANINDGPFPTWARVVVGVLLSFVPLLAGVRAAIVGSKSPKIAGALSGLVPATAIGLFLYLLVPLPVPPERFVGGVILSTLLSWLGAILSPLVNRSGR